MQMWKMKAIIQMQAVKDGERDGLSANFGPSDQHVKAKTNCQLL